MTREEAQKHAPSYLRMPDDGAKFRCYICKGLYHHSLMFIIFTPNGELHYPQCANCLDADWLDKAKDCGVAS